MMSIKDVVDMVNKEKEAQRRAKTIKKVAAGATIAALAAAAGLVTGVLIAPKPGKEMLEDLKMSCIHCCCQQSCCPESTGECGGSHGSCCAGDI